MRDGETLALKTCESGIREDFDGIAEKVDFLVTAISISKQTFRIGDFGNAVSLESAATDNGVAGDEITFGSLRDVIAEVGAVVGNAIKCRLHVIGRPRLENR